MAVIKQAFVLGAGLGTRLRPLTDEVPKPLVPIFHKPLITFAFDHLIGAGIERFCVNTHHQPQRFAETFPTGSYRGLPLQFRQEPVLLETGGGIANVADLLGDEPFLVYNADILSDLPLAPLLAEHQRSGNIVTLALRSQAGPQHISLDRHTGRLVDIRNLLGTGAPEEFVFTGIYAVEPEFHRWLQPGVKRSVIPTFLEMIRRGAKLGGVVIDEGHWWDVGTRSAYMQLHRDLPSLPFPHYAAPHDGAWRAAIHGSATVAEGATLRGCSVAGAGSHIGADAVLEDTIAWPGAQIASRSDLRNCIVRSHRKAEGTLRDIDV
ncbi:MAG: NTP transferase domain-containing protein [Chthoniobacterales bacterium]|nr:NTP transferase domain-containing protein [Chthoniobacterales bacterium]